MAMNTISILEKLERVGTAIFGGDWIEGLTEQEQLLVKILDRRRQIERERPQPRFNLERKWMPYATDLFLYPELGEAVEQAEYLRDLMECQRQEAHELLDAMGCLDTDDRAHFERAFAMTFADAPRAQGIIVKSTRAPHSIIKAASACKKWLSELASSHRENLMQTKGEVLASAQTKFPGLSRRQFEHAWSEMAPPSWRKAGRPRRDRGNRPTPENAKAAEIVEGQ
jgi:hypothetical protein